MATIAELQGRVGTEIGLSDWLLVDQPTIDRFADLTGDHQFIHVDPVRAAATPFGGTIAHGFLVLALLPKLAGTTDFALEGATFGVNYGFDKIRLVSPVRSGRRIRARFVLHGFAERGRGQWLATLSVTVEIEDEPKPAIVAEWLMLQMVAPPVQP
jgi:acyl dehydratase